MSATAAHRHFHDELSKLKDKLLTMSAEAQEALGLALDSLLKRDGDLAAQVIGAIAIDGLGSRSRKPSSTSSPLSSRWPATSVCSWPP